MEMQDEPYYSELEGVYHAVSNCPLGRRVPAEMRQSGTGNRAMCPACEARMEARKRLGFSGK